MDGGGGGETGCQRLGVSDVSNVGGVGSAGLGHENDGHRFLARLEAAGIAASRRRVEMCRRDSAGEELTTRKGAGACVAETGGRDGTVGGSAGERSHVLRLRWRQEWAW